MTTIDARPEGTAAAVADPAALEDRYAAHSYHPLPVTLVSGEGSWVTDAAGRRYLDLLAAYSAMNFGHANPRLTAVAHAQLDRLTLTSRAFRNDQLGPLCAELANLVGLDQVIPMNTGAEA
ncbi:MAG TPA: aminotransferase class III-fold pyridoxal phosphate-dependent enzyme, partial [Acidimicrobiales bacterium]